MADGKTPDDKARVSKSEFIRSQPSEKTAAQVVAEARARGIKFDEAYVYKIRRTATLKAGALKKGGTPSSGPDPAIEVKKPGKLSKADFVRARPDAAPRTIVEQAAAAGIKLGIRYVYNVRGSDKASSKRKPAPVVLAKTVGATTLKAASSSPEDLLRAVAAELGLGRAIDLLHGERARVQAILQG